MFLIYRLISPSGKSYIGLTSRSFIDRFNDHVWDWRSGNGYCKKLGQAFIKYPPSSWSHEILVETENQHEAQQKEVEFIKYFDSINNGYNILPGGGLGRLGIPHTEQTKEKIRKGNMGNKNGLGNKSRTGEVYSLEIRQKMSKSKLGMKYKPMSEQGKRNISLAHVGIKMPAFTQDHKNKIAQSQLGKKRSAEARRNISIGHLGIKPSLKTRKKLSECRQGAKNHFFGKNHSEETKRKISETKKLRYLQQKQLVTGVS